VNPENQNPQTDFKVREIRKLRFSATLQIFAAVFFTGAAFIVGSAQGWGLLSAVFIALATANIVFFIYVRKAMKSLAQK
jgi:O-antigen/teichoic acid export membrane protein